MILTLAFIGFASILAQVALLRELAVAFYGNELIVLVGLAIWMAWTGAGARLGGRGSSGLAGAMAALGAFLPAAAAFARSARILFGATTGAYLPFELQIAAIAIGLAPVGLALGFLFVRAARRYAAAGGTFAAAYGIESAGGVAGGAASAILLTAGVSASVSVIVLASLSLFIASFLGEPRGPTRALLRAAAGVLLALVVVAGGTIERATLRWHFPSLVANRESPYGRLTLTGRGTGQTELFVNGALAYDSESADPEAPAHIAMVQREEPGDVIVVGGGSFGIAREIMKHDPRSLTVVEPDRASLDLARRVFPGALAGEGGERGRVLVGDGRRSLRESPGSFDVVLVNAPEPTSGASNRFYTIEFFRECARSLRPGGVLAFRLPSPENYWSPLLARRNGSIDRALAAVFPETLVLPGEANVFLASMEPLDRDPDVLAKRLAARLEKRGAENRLVTPFHVRYLYTNDRRAEIERRLAEADAPPNTDLRPVCYPATLLLWLSRFYPRLGNAAIPEPGARSAVPALAAAAVLFLALRRRPAASRVAAVAFAGFAGVVLEFAVVLRFQTASGVLYRDLGLLLGGFMGGLAVSPLPGRAAARFDRGGALLLGALAAIAAATGALMTGGAFGVLPVAFVWLAIVGAAVGALFCRASLVDAGAGPPLYAADLFGGGAGALVGVLFLLPFAGLAPAAFFVALGAVAATICLR